MKYSREIFDRNIRQKYLTEVSMPIHRNCTKVSMKINNIWHIDIWKYLGEMFQRSLTFITSIPHSILR